MVDDTLQAGSDTIGTDHVSTLNGAAITPAAATPKIQRVKAAYGDDGTSRDVSPAFPLPVTTVDLTTSATITTTDLVVAAPAGAGALVSGASTAGSLVALACGAGDSAWNVQITGLTTGTIHFETSLDSTNGVNGNWINVNGRQTGIVNTVLSGNATTNGIWRGDTSGAAWIRARSVGTLTGTPAIIIRVSDGIGAVFLNASIPGGANVIGNVGLVPSTLLVTGTAAAAAALTVTLPAVVGQFHYITTIQIALYSSAARTGAATPIVVTSTNLPGSAAWTFSTAGAIGTIERYELDPSTPLRSSVANTATTIVAPVVTGGIWRTLVTYYAAA